MAEEIIDTTDTDEDIIAKVNKWYKEAKDASSTWREESKESYNFPAGHQWSESDITKLTIEKRPVITFNWIAPMIDAVLGIEIDQRNEIKFQPREINDTALTDAINEVVKYLRDSAFIDAEEAQIFEDVLIGGMGWSESKIDYSDDLDGEFKQERVDPFEMYWDTASRKRNLIDRRWQIRAKKMTLDEIKEIWPDKEFIGGEEDEKDIPETITIVNPAERYTDELSSPSKKEKRLTVLHSQWFEMVNVYRTNDPVTGEIMEFSQEDYEKYKPVLEMTNTAILKQRKKKYHQAFIVGSSLLETGLCPSQSRFSFTCATGKYDRTKVCWYGLVRAMKDPQRWSNKFFSEILDIINANAKGGLIVEEGTFMDSRKAEDDWAKTDSIVYVKTGAIAQGKILPKPQSPYPQGLDRLMNFSVNAIRGVSGINLELLGQTPREQAGIVEQIRKKSAFSILAWIFESLRQYRKYAGMLTLEFIKEYIPIEQMQRVLSAELAPYAQIIKGLTPSMVDVVVSEAPTSDNNKMLVWTFLSQLLPFIMKAGIPVPPDVLEYTPLPATLIAKWKQMLVTTPPPMPEGGGQQGAGGPAPQNIGNIVKKPVGMPI